MSGAALSPAPSAPRSAEPGPPELFAGLVVSDPPRVRRGYWLPASLLGHIAAAALLILGPILWPSAPPDQPDYIRALIYNPPPPPPPPLPKGAALVEKAEPVKPVTPEVKPEKPKFTAPLQKPKEEPLRPEARPPETEQVGRESGSDLGLPEGMEEGVEGGVVGGVPGGVLGGVVGGTGDMPVLDYDQPPRAVKITKPQYPSDGQAFVKKIEGTVELEIIIDTTGRVARARVVRSIPLLDRAAVECVSQWVFQPAMKNGRPVATISRATVTFRIL